MDDDLFKEDDDDIHKIGVVNKNHHKINKKTYHFQIDYDSSLGYYSTRLSIDVVYLPVSISYRSKHCVESLHKAREVWSSFTVVMNDSN